MKSEKIMKEGGGGGRTEDIAKIIQNDNQSTSMFKAVKIIKNPTVENNVLVHNDKGETIISKIDKYNTVKNYFKKNERRK